MSILNDVYISRFLKIVYLPPLVALMSYQLKTCTVKQNGVSGQDKGNNNYRLLMSNGQIGLWCAHVLTSKAFLKYI
jgi:hypothetical protein